ncbi:thioredoxin family protein [Yeosuana marina]|uniref:thioredoxin family protein n=1 Tax=Yeosuana marina TaxID=1565536 RepID=UPI00141EAD7B|nr:thioredoxin family protein [Yeosuana marina]|tara:strand:+ start:1530 stop:2150 length:621 start_codon:yes stop_codon:yes gene_type:complete
MNEIIKNGIERSMSYMAYRSLMKQLVEENSNTGLEKNESLAEYTKLNDRRMNRWDKTLKIADDSKAKLSHFNDNITWLVITESWCGDAAHIVPVLYKIAELININFRVVLRDENLELMDQFLTNGARAIPKLIMIDNVTGNVLNTFGPRPLEATKMVIDYKEQHGAITPEFKEALQVWYNKNKGQSIINDIIEILCKLEPSICQQN